MEVLWGRGELIVLRKSWCFPLRLVEERDCSPSDRSMRRGRGHSLGPRKNPLAESAGGRRVFETAGRILTASAALLWMFKKLNGLNLPCDRDIGYRAIVFYQRQESSLKL
jgi:hypothetical protein